MSKQTPTDRAKALLIENMGEDTFKDLQKGTEICVEGKGDTKYILRKTSDDNITISKTTNIEHYIKSKRQWSAYKGMDGKITAWNIVGLYDTAAAFIQNVKHDTLEWGCGTFYTKLPTKMPIVSLPNKPKHTPHRTRRRQTNRTYDDGSDGLLGLIKISLGVLLIVVVATLLGIM